MAGDKGVDTRPGARQAGARSDQSGYRAGRPVRPNAGGGRATAGQSNSTQAPFSRKPAPPGRKTETPAKKKADADKVKVIKKRAEGATPANFITKDVREAEDKPRKPQEQKDQGEEDLMNGTTNHEDHTDQNNAPKPHAEVKEDGNGDDVVVFRNNEENVIMTPEPDSDVSKKAARPDVISPPPQRVHHPQEGEKFDVQCFHASVRSFIDVFASAHYQSVHDEYRVDEVLHEVPVLLDQLKKYKAFLSSTLMLMEELRPCMKTAQENIKLSYTREAFKITSEEDLQTPEQLRQREKHAQLTAEVARASAEVAEAVRLCADAEATAVRAQLMAERAEEEAERLAQEAETKKRVEEERRIAEEKRKEEERKKKEEEERRKEEEKRRKEEEWRRHENSSSNRPGIWEQWPVIDYADPHVPDSGVACVIRGNPARFRAEDARVEVLDESNLDLPFTHDQELISHVVNVTSPRGETTFQEPIYVAIPHSMARSSALSREPVVRELQDGRSVELPTTEVSIDKHKDLKFAQAEVKHPCKIFVMAQLKHDYVTLGRKHHTVTSSYDHRVSLTLEKDTLVNIDHFLLQVHPVDSATVHDFRSRDPNGKGLLTSSPVVFTQWESTEFKKPVHVSVPCPPNPARARKLAELKRQKEEKMKKPAPPKTIQELDREEERKKEKLRQLQQLQQQLLSGDDEPHEKARAPTRWYMGQYGSSDDDEHDLLYLVLCCNNRWAVCRHVDICQAKLDLLTFDLPKPCEQFMVLRTKTTVEEEEAVIIASNLTAFLHRRSVQMLLRQKSSEPGEVAVAVVPVPQVERQTKKMEEYGYDDGPPPSPVFSLTEGDFLQVNFKGNIRSQDSEPLSWFFHSSKPAVLCVSVEEVDRYLQRNFPVYRGALELVSPKTGSPASSKQQQQQQQQQQAANGRKGRGETMDKGALAHMMITLPKDNLEVTPPPKIAPIIIRDSRDVNTDLLRTLASDLGDEWRHVARELSVTSTRLQAIHRNVAAVEGTEEDLKYQVLLAWLKRAPKALDKVKVLGVALTRSGRPDLADMVRTRKEDFRAAMTAH